MTDLFSSTSSGSSTSEKKKIPFIKLGNKDPQGNSPLEPGKLYGYDKNEIEPFPAVILKLTNIREFKRKNKEGKWETPCRSYDGLVPAPSVKDPFCKKTTAAQIAEELKAKGVKDVVIDKTIEEVTDGNVLTCCAQVNPKTGAVYPKCMMAKYDEVRSQAGPCKQSIRLIGWNINTESLFQMVISKSHMRDGTSLRDFITFVQQNGGKKEHVMCLLKGEVEESGFAKLGFLEPSTIQDQILQEQMAERLTEVESIYEAMSSWVPEEEKAKEDTSASDQSGVVAESEEDDIPF